MNLNYSINGVSFSSLGITVTSSKGLLPGLPLKEPFSVNWPDSHGEDVDLSYPRYGVRKIALDCHIKCASPEQLITNMSTLVGELIKTGTKRLQLFPVANKPLVYDVYCPDGVDIDKKWRDSPMHGDFTLNLTEPQPVKWVLQTPGTAGAGIGLSAPSPIRIAWGDGSFDELLGSNQLKVHNYATPISGPYYVIVSGELERMTNPVLTNLTQLWPRLY